jgi:hypothetical protein
VAISPDVVERAIAEIGKSRANYEYFFERLSSPDWIRPLRQHGLFENPPPLEIDDRGIRAEPWPPSKYLARVASKSPEQVLDVILAVSTSNERVHEDFARAAASMPAYLARRWAAQELLWLRQTSRLYFLLPRELVGLVATLAAGNEADLAVAISEELFRPLPAPSEVAGLLNLDSAAPRFSKWDYGDLLARAAMATVQVAPAGTVRTLVHLLARAIGLAFQGGSEPTEDDLSFLWRTRVANSERDDRNIQQALVSTLRDAAIKVREDGLVSDAQLLEILSQGGTAVFRRISMSVWGQPPPADPPTIERLLVDRDQLFEPEPSPEYRELLHNSFHRLDLTGQQTVLGWIDEGPDLQIYRETRIQTTGEIPTESDTEAYVARWRIRRLQLISGDLPREWARRYEQLVERYGPSEFVTSFEVQMEWGPKSPVPFDNLLSRPDDDLISLLRDFQGEADDWLGPSPEGLARELSASAEKDPGRISRLAPRLIGLRPVYVQWALIGLATAVRNGNAVDWTSLLELLEYVTPMREEFTEGDEENYGRWEWVNKDVASLLHAGFESTRFSVPFELRARAWRIVESLSGDPEPSRVYEERYGGSNMDPMMLALNTTRGQAMFAVVAYALWVHRAKEDGSYSPTSTAFDMMPEVREVLDRHLDPYRDPSVAVRAVYGRSFPWLALIDEGWASQATRLIFPEDDEAGGELRDAAWHSYVLYNQPRDAMLQILRAQYSQAVDRLNAEPRPWRWVGGGPRSPEQHLAGHLMTFYLRGVLDLAEANGLLERFFADASPEVRAFAIEFIGRGLRQMESLEDVTRERLERLWDWRIGEAEQSRREDRRKEVAAFSWWADADSLSPEWRIAHLERVLAVGGSIKDDSVTLAAIAKLAHHFPARSIRLLRTFLELVRGGWTIEANTPEIKSILHTCLTSGDPGAIADVQDTVHWLGSLGYWTFRELLRGEVPT